MAKRNSSKKPNIAMCAAFVMLCLTLISIHLTSGLYAKYMTGSSVNDSARVAKFEISASSSKSFPTIESTFVLESITPSDEFKQVKTFVIDNESEVVVECKLVVKNLTGNIPLVFDYTKDILIAPGKKESVDLLVKWPVEGALAYIGMVDLFEIEIEVNQVD